MEINFKTFCQFNQFLKVRKLLNSKRDDKRKTVVGQIYKYFKDLNGK